MVFMEKILSLEKPFVPLLLFIMQWGFAGLWGAYVAEEDHCCAYELPVPERDPSSCEQWFHGGRRVLVLEAGPADRSKSL